MPSFSVKQSKTAQFRKNSCRDRLYGTTDKGTTVEALLLIKADS